MTRFVIDASAALFAVSGPRGTARLRRHEILAPPLLWSEVTAAIRQRVFRSELSAELADRALKAFHAAPIERVVDEAMYANAHALATSSGWAKTYDAEYVVLAQMLEVPLLTADARLARGAADMVDLMAGTDL